MRALSSALLLAAIASVTIGCGDSTTVSNPDASSAIDGGADTSLPIDSSIADTSMVDAPAPIDAPASFSCAPTQQATTKGGDTCAGLDQAYTARGINVGYYAFKVKKPTPQYSGDYTGDPTKVFSPGTKTPGVILQILPPGSYVGLSTSGPFFDPVSSCTPPACGGSSGACKDDAPPMRPTVFGMAWGYGYTNGASHMQGWIPFDPSALEFAGFDPAHPCALGPAGVDFEATSACGKPTSCAGKNSTCAATNPCSEGADDCADTACGSISGGPLTPAAWQKTVAKPAAHACTKTTPHPSVECLANGSDQDFFFVYPFGAYAYWGQNSTTRYWLHYGDKVQVYFHNRDASNVMWDFVEVLQTGAPVLTPASDGSGAPSGCTSGAPGNCHPCKNGGACGWVQDVFLK